MQWGTALAVIAAPTLAWVIHKSVLPFSRFLDRRMKDGRFKRALLGSDRDASGRLR